MEFTATVPAGGTFNRELHRLSPSTGELEFRAPDFEEEYGVPDPKRYILAFTGYSDVFEEEGFNTTDLVDKVIVEFEVVNSRKWQGVRFSQVCKIPKDWTDDRGTLHQLFSALQGRKIEAGDAINFANSLGKQFEAVVENQTSQKGRDYAKIATFLPLSANDDDDDVIPAKPIAKATPATDDDFPTS